MEKEVREDPGECKPLVPTAPEQEEHKELPLRDDEEQHGRSGDRVRRGGLRDEQERRRLDDPHQRGQRRSHQDETKTFPTRRAYVYSVLGAQAQTRWPIVGQGAKSLQTQDIFHKLVRDTITQDDPVKAISAMRLAIKNTNVVLNLAISPGLILIPSDMIILKEKVAGITTR